jgi:hypothetical protein
LDPPGVEAIGDTAGVPTGDGSALGAAARMLGVAPAVPPFVPFALPRGLAAKLGARVSGMALAPLAGVVPPATEGLAALNLGTLLLGVSAVAAAPRLVAEAFAPEARAAAFSFACAGVTAFAGVVMLARDEGETTLPRAPPPPLLPPPPMLLAPLVMLPRVVMFEPICVFSCVIAIWSRSE